MSDATTRQVGGSFGGADDEGKKGFFGRFNAKLQDAVEQGRTEDMTKRPPENLAKQGAIPADDMALRNAESVVAQRMIVPEGVVIEGMMTSSSDTQISGRIQGDLRVEARLVLEPSSVVTGTVHASSCTVRGRIDGNLESPQDVTVGDTGVINADVIAGKDMNIAGEINGNVKCGGRLRLTPTAKLKGNIRTRSLVVEEGAKFNGTCNMTRPAPAKGAKV